MSDNGRAAGVVIAVIAVASIAGACQQILGPSDDDANWRVHQSARFSLYVRPGSFAEQNAPFFGEVLEDQYTFARDVLALTYAGRISVFLYDSPADAGREFALSGTAYPATESVKAVCVPPLDGNLLAFLGHEANHVVTINGLGRPGTSFMSEGLASAILSEKYHQLGKHFLYSWTAANMARLEPIATLADDGRWKGLDQRVAYNASASFLAFLLDTYGRERLHLLFPVGSDDFAARFAEIYGRSLAAIETEWKAFVTRGL
jgi:hypothetical protein